MISMSGDDTGMRYVWLDISISQFHTGCKFLAVNYFYVYAAATGGVIYIASVNCPCEPGVFAYGKDIRVVGHSRFRNFHVCKLLAVNSFYVYATAAGGVQFRVSYLLRAHRRTYIWKDLRVVRLFFRSTTSRRL